MAHSLEAESLQYQALIIDQYHVAITKQLQDQHEVSVLRPYPDNYDPFKLVLTDTLYDPILEMFAEDHTEGWWSGRLFQPARPDPDWIRSVLTSLTKDEPPVRAACAGLLRRFSVDNERVRDGLVKAFREEGEARVCEAIVNALVSCKLEELGTET